MLAPRRFWQEIQASPLQPPPQKAANIHLRHPSISSVVFRFICLNLWTVGELQISIKPATLIFPRTKSILLHGNTSPVEVMAIWECATPHCIIFALVDISACLNLRKSSTAANQYSALTLGYSARTAENVSTRSKLSSMSSIRWGAFSALPMLMIGLKETRLTPCSKAQAQMSLMSY